MPFSIDLYGDEKVVGTLNFDEKEVKFKFLSPNTDTSKFKRNCVKALELMNAFSKYINEKLTIVNDNDDGFALSFNFKTEKDAFNFLVKFFKNIQSDSNFFSVKCKEEILRKIGCEYYSDSDYSDYYSSSSSDSDNDYPETISYKSTSKFAFVSLLKKEQAREAERKKEARRAEDEKRAERDLYLFGPGHFNP